MHRPLLRLFVWLAFINSTLDILIKDSNLAFGVNIRYIVRCTISKPEVNTSISSDRGTNLFKPPQFSLYKETMTYMYKRKKIKQLLNLTCSYLQLLKSLFVNDQLISLTRVKLQQFSIVLIFFSVLKIENKHKILQYCVVSLQASTPGQKKNKSFFTDGRDVVFGFCAFGSFPHLHWSYGGFVFGGEFPVLQQSGARGNRLSN